jgi:diguanylate cyclase (GGDEF)-like protein
VPAFYRTLIACSFCLVLALVAFAPTLLGSGPAGVELLGLLAHLAGPLVAAICCFVAAWRARGSDRAAWINFGIGSSLYVAGNVWYVIVGIAGMSLAFPAAPEALYFVMALFMAAGIFQYGNLRARISRLQIYNFLLIYCAVALATLFLLHESIGASVMGPFATVVAFAYPALWFSVAAFGLLSIMLYSQRDTSFAFALLIGAIAAEAGADYIYALRLMDGTYQIGGLTQLLWIASTGLLIWAAFEQMSQPRLQAAELPRMRRQGDRGLAQAAIPAVAVALILLSGASSGALAAGPFFGFAVALVLIFVVAAGLREHWVMHLQRRLSVDAALSRTNLARSQERLATVLRSTSDSVVVLDREWRIEFLNEQAVKTVMQVGSLKLGASFWDFVPEDSHAGQLCRRAFDSQQPVEFEEHFPQADMWLEISAYPTPEGLSLFCRDISERRRIREELTHLAHHDALTGLVNRRVFQERLKDGLASRIELATLLIDLDHFKEVNDTRGHPVGDALLVEMATRLAACVGPPNIVARLGGDEFAIIMLEHADTAALARLAQRILDIVRVPHSIDGQVLRVGASIGIALSKAASDADQILSNADIALYAAKGDARGGFRFFEPAMVSGLQQRQALRADVAAALDNGEFELAYQPIVDLRSGTVCCFEALLRWHHPQRGLVPPDIFIPIAEESGAIIDIGDWVVRTACVEATRWPDTIRVAINLSSRQFISGDLACLVASVLKVTGLAPGRVELEITESVLMKDSHENLRTLGQLRDMGVRIALDDFGTGYSSLAYLQRFAFNKLKIDRSFISGLPASGESQAIVRSVVGLGKSLGIRITAEGVETKAQLDWVAAGCDEAQGYFLGRPVPADEIPAVISLLGAVTGSARAEARRLAG